MDRPKSSMRGPRRVCHHILLGFADVKFSFFAFADLDSRDFALRLHGFPKAKDKEWKEPICLSGAVVASSGQMKTPTWKTFTNVVVEVEMDWRKEQQQAYAEYLTKKKEYDQVQKQNKSNVAKGNDEQRIVSMPAKAE